MARAKILVVDQDENAYEHLKLGLARHGYEIHTASTVPYAVNLAGAHAYQAALVAHSFLHHTAILPGLRAEIPDLPVILVFSPSTPTVALQDLDRAENAMGKPLALEPVRLMLDRTLELAMLRTRLKQRQQRICHVWDFVHGQETLDGHEAPKAGSFDELLEEQLRVLVLNMMVLGKGTLHRAVLSHVEKMLLNAVLTECRGNQVKSAEILGVNRNTLRKKLQAFDLLTPRRSA